MLMLLRVFSSRRSCLAKYLLPMLMLPSMSLLLCHLMLLPLLYQSLN